MARHSGIILVSLIAHVFFSLSSNIHVNESSEDITEKCVIDILTSKTQYGSIVTVVNGDTVWSVWNKLLQQIHLSNNVNVCLKDFNVSIAVKPSIYLIYAQNETEFEHIIDSLDRDWFRQPGALFIVIVKYKFEDYLAKLFKLLWEYHFIHVLVIVKDLENDATVYTYFPYGKGGCGRDFSTVVKLCDCKSVREVDVVRKLREYDEPVLDNCTLNVAIRNMPPLVFCDPEPEDKLTSGVERFLIEHIFQRNNISLNYTCFPQTEDVGTISDNFTVSGILEKLYENGFDMVFGGLSLNNRRVDFFDYLCDYMAYEDMYVTVTHRSPLIERWKIVYMMFDANIWVLLLFTTVFCAVMLADFGNLWMHKSPKATITELLILFGNATQNVKLALREKLFKNFVIVHWLWFIFLISCFYQTRLTSFTTYRVYKPQLNKYFSLNDTNLAPCIPPDIVLFLQNSGKVPIINEKLMVTGNCDTAEMALDEITKTRSTYALIMYFQYLWWLRNHAKEYDRVYLMKESVYNNLYGLFLKRGFPLLRTYHAIMLRLPEHGFVRASKDFHGLPREQAVEGTNALVKLVRTPLKLEDLTIPFGILATGMAFSLVTFIIEMKPKSKVRLRMKHRLRNYIK